MERQVGGALLEGAGVQDRALGQLRRPLREHPPCLAQSGRRGGPAKLGTCGRGVEKRIGPRDLREVLDELRDALAGPERLRAVERTRATIVEAVGVEMFVGNLRSGSTSAAGAWMNRRFGAA
jgi:hypothetical protein